LEPGALEAPHDLRSVGVDRVLVERRVVALEARRVVPLELVAAAARLTALAAALATASAAVSTPITALAFGGGLGLDGEGG